MSFLPSTSQETLCIHQPHYLSRLLTLPSFGISRLHLVLILHTKPLPRLPLLPTRHTSQLFIPSESKPHSYLQQPRKRHFARSQDRLLWPLRNLCWWHLDMQQRLGWARKAISTISGSLKLDLGESEVQGWNCV